jgi:spore germination protein (amino acid permease)
MMPITKDNQRLTFWQWVFIITGAQIEMSAFNMSSTLSREVRQDVWIVTLVSLLLPLASLWMISRVARRSSAGNLVDLSRRLYGWLGGSALIILLTVYLLAVGAGAARLFSETIKATLLPETPLPVICSGITFIGFFIISQGTKIVGRINSLLFYLFLLNMIVFLLPVSGSGEITNLFPVAVLDWDQLGHALLTAVVYFQGIEVALVLFPLLPDRNEVFKAGALGLGIAGTAFILMAVKCVVVFGVDYLQTLNWPPMDLLNIVPNRLVPRWDLFFLSLWVGIGIRPVVNTLFASALNLDRLLAGRVPWKRLTLTLVVLIDIIACLPCNISQVCQISRYIGLIGIFFMLGYPLLFWAGTAWRRRGKYVEMG